MDFCSFCDHRGIICNTDAYLTGSDPLLPCPKCVLDKCKCGGKEPFYYIENNVVKECYCRPVRIKILRINYLYKTCGIEKKFLWRFISDFQCKTQKDNTAKKEAYNIITNFPNVEKGLYLWGNPGTGKTLLSTIILTELITRNAIEGRFLKISRNFFGKLRASYNESSDNYGMGPKIEKEIADTDILILDDFGTQRDSQWEQETMYNLVDSRYEAEKFTVFTSNLDPNKYLKEISEGRILSRIKEMCTIIELSGPDKREEK